MALEVLSLEENNGVFFTCFPCVSLVFSLYQRASVSFCYFATSTTFGENLVSNLTLFLFINAVD